MLAGIYCLVGKLTSKADIKIGSLGLLELDEGYYAYVGSAINNLEKRVERHFKKRKTLRWHIDYLVAHPYFFPMTAIYRKTSNKEEEHQLANIMNGESVPGFGCSDCRCESHLFFMGKNLEIVREELERTFFKLGGLHGYFEAAKNVIFDLDDTLVEYGQARRLALEELGRKYLKDPRSFVRSYELVKLEHYANFPELPKKYLKGPLFASLVEKLGLNADPKLLEREYWELVLKNLSPVEGVIEVLKWLEGLGMKVYVFSDGIRKWQEAKLLSVGILSTIEKSVYSEDIGLNKVNPESYERMLALLRLRREESIYVGDDLLLDVKNPLKVGLRSILLSRGKLRAYPAGVPVIRSLLELKGILKLAD